MSLPDFETAIVNRLYLNNLEIGGFKRVLMQSPIMPLEIGEYPAAMVRVGALRQPIPTTAPGQVQISRDYIIELPIAPYITSQDTKNQGADVLGLVLPWFAIVRNYYLNHPRLHTDGTPTNAAQPALPWIHGDIFFTDSGVVQMPVSGGVTFLGVLYTLSITCRALVTTIE
jgi:hypothetical protein